jgi:hypothetical protein
VLTQCHPDRLVLRRPLVWFNWTKSLKCCTAYRSSAPRRAEDIPCLSLPYRCHRPKLGRGQRGRSRMSIENSLSNGPHSDWPLNSLQRHLMTYRTRECSLWKIEVRHFRKVGVSRWWRRFFLEVAVESSIDCITA